MEAALRLYLLAGLVAHKALWEFLRPRSGSPEPAARNRRQLLTKAAKLLILAGLLAQTLGPDFLPIGGDPAARRVLGVTIYTAGLLLAVLGRLQLGRNWSDIEAPQVRSQQALVATGIYRYIRHPIYVGDMMLLLGIELSLNSWLLAGALALTPFVLRQALREEAMLLNRLPGYQDYLQRTKRFIPFVV